MEAFDDLQKKIGYSFSNPSLLERAFIHCSYVNENREVEGHNERLEFLGDAVLELIVSNYLYQKFPEMPEGELSFLRSRLVEATSCVDYVQKLQVESYLLLGRGEKQNKGRGRESILADLLEAIVGAIYLDGGIEAAKEFLFSHFKDEMEEIVATPISNWKAVLQDYCQKKYRKAPVYQVVSAIGPDHSKIFCVEVLINEKCLGKGEGSSKKEAQQEAAKQALEELEHGG